MKIIRGIIKALIWILERLFGFRNSLYSDLDRYRSRGIIGRVLIMIFLTGFCVLTVLLEKWMVDVFEQNILLGILLVLVFIPFALSTIKMSFIHIFVGFKSARMTRKEQRAEAKLEKANESELQETSGENKEESVVEELPKKKRYRGFDVFFGFYSLLLFAGLIFGIVYCFITYVLG